MRARRASLLLGLLGAACPHAGSALPVGGAGAAHRASEGGASGTPSEAGSLALRVEALDAEARAVTQALDEALWAHWTRGAPLDLARAQAGHDALFSKASLATLRRARELGAGEPRALQHLQHFIEGELLARALVEENTTLSNLEASATFSLDGREQAWRELNRLLVNEKSAVKRRALWTASLKTAERFDAALAHREAKAREALAALDIPSALELAAETRELDLESLAKAADAFLTGTEAPWEATLKRLADAELRLPVGKLTRADLPQLFRVHPTVDGAFPRSKVAERGVQLLSGLGLSGDPGLTLELSEGPKKNPLPLTVAPRGAADVRVSFRPLGGLRDQAALLSELGHAEALRHVEATRFAYLRLGDPGATLVTGELFSGLLQDPAFLEALGLPPALLGPVAEAAVAMRLLSLRREAGGVLAKLETQDLPEPEARARFLEVMNRALGVRHGADDGVRWRLDTDEFLRSATSFRAALLTAQVRQVLMATHGPTWWKSPAAGETLRALWAPGTSLPVEGRLGVSVAAVPLLVHTLGGTPPAAAPPTVDGQDAGVTALATPWPRPAQLAIDGGR